MQINFPKYEFLIEYIYIYLVIFVFLLQSVDTETVMIIDYDNK